MIRIRRKGVALVDTSKRILVVAGGRKFKDYGKSYILYYHNIYK